MNEEPIDLTNATNILNQNLLSLARHAVTGMLGWVAARGWIDSHLTGSAFSEALAVGVAGAAARAAGLAWAWLRKKQTAARAPMIPQQESRALPDVPVLQAKPVLPAKAGDADANAVYGGVNPAGMALIKEAEGLYLKAYECPAGVWTIGWGHTGLTHQDGTVYSGRVITREKAEELLSHDMIAFAWQVRELVKVALTGNQFSALVSFAFNIGLGGFATSTLLCKLNDGNYQGAAEEFERWVHCKGKVLKGLVIRRAAEKRLFLSPGAIEFKPA